MGPAPRPQTLPARPPVPGPTPYPGPSVGPSPWPTAPEPAGHPPAGEPSIYPGSGPIPEEALAGLLQRDVLLERLAALRAEGHGLQSRLAAFGLSWRAACYYCEALAKVRSQISGLEHRLGQLLTHLEPHSSP